ncbi:MAG: nuclear transport factor 2 family protein [Alphaproteobacteria bacterium]|nr:nuclear transport factor 2 family protein [Alphaproteobacteria bacterium]
MQDISQPAVDDNRPRKLAIVTQLMEARLRARFDVLEAIAIDDVTVRILGDRVFSPFAGSYHGKPSARAALERLSIEFEYLNVKTEYVMVDGDQVGLRWRGILRNRGTSAQGEFEGFVHIVFSGDRVKEYVAYIDTAALARLAS